MLEMETIPVRVLGVHESVMKLVTLESLGNGDNTSESVQTPRERNHWERLEGMLEVEMIPVRVLGVHESVMELVT